MLNVVLLLLLKFLGVVQLKPFSWRLAQRLLVPAVCGAAQLVLSLWAQASAHSGVYPLAGRLLPLAGLAWTHLLAKSRPGFDLLTCSVVALTVTSAGISGER